MPLPRSARAAGHGLRLALFLLFTVYATRQLIDIAGSYNGGAGAFFWLLVLAGTLSLVWRAGHDFRKSVRKLRG